MRNPYDLSNAIITMDNKDNDCFLFYSRIPAQSAVYYLQIIQSTKDSILRQPHPFRHCISADAMMSKRFANLLSQQIPGLRDTCRRTKLLTRQTFLFWDHVGNRYIYNLLTETKNSEKPNYLYYH